MVANCPETGLLAVYTEDCKLLHNTIWEPKSRLGRLIWAHQKNDRLLVGGNLVIGPRPKLQGEGKIDQVANVVLEGADEFLVDPARGDLHLRTKQSKVVVPDQKPQTKLDFDSQERSGLTAGADDVK
jgi:hypothetical protein